MKYFIDKEDTNKEPKAIDLGFLHYMAAGMSISDIHRMPKEDLIKVGNEYLEKEKSAIKAFEKLLKKYSHMKENIKPEDRVSLSDLLESGCSVCGNGPCTNESGCNSHKNEDYDADKAQKEDEEDEERGYDDDGLPLGEDYNQAGEFEPKHLMDLAPGEEFTFNGKTYTFIKMAGGDEITAHVEDSTGFELVVSFGGGMVNTGEVSGTSMADMGQGKGHHIDEEEEDRDEELIAKLTPVSQVLDEGYYESSHLEQMISDLGYDGFQDFFNDNQGAEEAVEEFILSVKDFRDKLGRTDDEDLYEEEGVEPGSDKWKMILRTLTPGSKEYFNWLDMLTKGKATDKPYSRKGVKEDVNEFFGKKKVKKELDPWKDSPKSEDDLPPGYSMGNTTLYTGDDEEEDEGEVEKPVDYSINGFTVPFKDMKTLSRAYDLIVKRFRSKSDKGVFDLRSTKTPQDELDRFPNMKDYIYQLHISTNNMDEFVFREMVADLFREYNIHFPYTQLGADSRLFKGNSLGNLHRLQEDEDGPGPDPSSLINEAPNFDIIDKCLADYRKWARKQAPDSQELYDTTQAFIKTLERLM